jgi:sec-independent protein translocase protein TatA
VDVGVPELLIVLIVVLVVFGPTRLPKLARSLGEAIHHFREGSSDARSVPRDDSADTPPEG